MPDSRVSFRPAEVSDCATIARLYQISSYGVADYIWTQLVAPGEDPLEVGRRRYERGLHKTSLIVFEQNEGARRLYERLGYREVAREPICPHPLIHYDGDALLLVK